MGYPSNPFSTRYFSRECKQTHATTLSSCTPDCCFSPAVAHSNLNALLYNFWCLPLGMVAMNFLQLWRCDLSRNSKARCARPSYLCFCTHWEDCRAGWCERYKEKKESTQGLIPGRHYLSACARGRTCIKLILHHLFAFTALNGMGRACDLWSKKER